MEAGNVVQGRNRYFDEQHRALSEGTHDTVFTVQ